MAYGTKNTTNYRKSDHRAVEMLPTDGGTRPRGQRIATTVRRKRQQGQGTVGTTPDSVELVGTVQHDVN